MVNIYVDGSCVNLGMSSASAGFGVFVDDGTGRSHSGKLGGAKQDNHRAEAEAVRQALVMLNGKWGDLLKQLVVIVTDSLYVTNNIERGQNAQGDCDIFGSIAHLKNALGSNVSIEKVKAHSGIPGHEQADRLAYAAAKSR